MEYSALYSYGSKAIEQHYLRHTLFKPFLLAINTPCVQWTLLISVDWLQSMACAHFFAGPRSRTFPSASICHAVLFGSSSGTVHCPRHHRASYQCPSELPDYELVDFSLPFRLLRCARAAAMRVDVNEPTYLETAKALWA